MNFKKMFNIFYEAINNEIAVEKYILKKLNKTNIGFNPIRSLKSIRLIEKYKINKFFYILLCLFFILFSPLYFFIKFLKNIKLKNNQYLPTLKETIVLISNSKIKYLFNKISNKKNISYININQNETNNEYIPYSNYLKFYDYIIAYFLSIYSIFYLFVKLEKKTDILQAYVSYEWFIVYLSLNRIRKHIKTVYFANHYDRWAVMFDQLFFGKKVILIQHGILPENLILHYKLKNINIIYCFDSKSKNIFKKLFNIKNTKFKKIDLKLSLTNINTKNKSILLIGQPQSIEKELKILKSIDKKFTILVKPHPLYDNSEYKKIKDITVIENVNYFPKVDVALCYESTLGLEYEASGIKVIWWKNVNLKLILEKNI